MHIHVTSSVGEAKYWLEPQIELARNHNIARPQLTEIEGIIEENYDEFKVAWNKRSGN